jgi:hypothetical protein
MSGKKYHAVTCRVSGDDEDSIYVSVVPETTEQARSNAKEMLGSGKDSPKIYILHVVSSESVIERIDWP